MPKEKNSRMWASWIIWAVVILALSRFMAGEQQVSVAVGTEGLSFKTESGYTSQLGWDDISALEVRADFAYGTLVEGTDTDKEKSGIWTNDALGEYELIAEAKISACIICSTRSGRVVAFNFESEESTRSLYEAIQEKITGI